MDVNYLIEINGLDDWEFGNPLSATAYKVMRKLLMIANRQRFPEKIAISNTKLCFLVGCTEKSLIAARQQLIQRGLIEYKGKKKQTPVYIFHYFSHDPRYNRKNSSYNGGINGGYDGGIGGSIPGGHDGGSIINNTYGDSEGTEDEDCDTDALEIPAEDQTMGKISPSSPSPTLPCVDVLQAGRTFPPRTRPLTEEEIVYYSCARAYLENAEHITPMYGKGYGLMMQLLNSDFYPLGLVGYAFEKTYKRNSMFPAPLGNPAAYTIKLLNDWKASGYTCAEDVQEDKDDWTHMG